MVEPRLYTISTASEVEISSRKDDISTLAQLHTDHGNLLQSYRHVNVPSVDPKCPKCGEDQHTLEQWLIECPAPATTRLHLSRTSQAHHAGRREGWWPTLWYIQEPFTGCAVAGQIPLLSANQRCQRTEGKCLITDICTWILLWATRIVIIIMTIFKHNLRLYFSVSNGTLNSTIPYYTFQ